MPNEDQLKKYRYRLEQLVCHLRILLKELDTDIAALEEVPTPKRIRRVGNTFFNDGK